MLQNLERHKIPEWENVNNAENGAKASDVTDEKRSEHESKEEHSHKHKKTFSAVSLSVFQQRTERRTQSGTRIE